MALRLPRPLGLPCSLSAFSTSILRGKKPLRLIRCSTDNQTAPSADARKLVLEVKDKLKTEHPDLPVGKNGRDDEDMILWFLKDRRFSVEDAVFKLTKAILLSLFFPFLGVRYQDSSIRKFFSAVKQIHPPCSQENFSQFIKWRQEFSVSELTEESVRNLYETGKAYVHDFLDVQGRPVLVVVVSKHFPGVQDPKENEKLCVFLIEKALCKISTGRKEILTIIDLRGFCTENADISFLRFLIDVFYYYYPKRLGQVLFVDAPFVFQPVWQLVRPWLKSYASLVRFCDVATVRKEYFTEATLPASFKA